ncbi:hypothetical protein WN51_11780 [Melipona quadrifasciata]|uniref:Uncharacterized protein n=1 Tax=Melipona quadrifasciata TaxID=166423 RepID=A0A0N0U6D5_9HYME|nr:hypothetical protein WN51_11780 [Melipona quadrifasciata]
MAITTYQRTIINCADMDYMNYADLYFQSIARRGDTHPVAAMMIIIIIGSGPPAQFRTMRPPPPPLRIVKYIRATHASEIAIHTAYYEEKSFSRINDKLFNGNFFLLVSSPAAITFCRVKSLNSYTKKCFEQKFHGAKGIAQRNSPVFYTSKQKTTGPAADEEISWRPGDEIENPFWSATIFSKDVARPAIIPSINTDLARAPCLNALWNNEDCLPQPGKPVTFGRSLEDPRGIEGGHRRTRENERDRELGLGSQKGSAVPFPWKRSPTGSQSTGLSSTGVKGETELWVFIVAQETTQLYSLAKRFVEEMA